MAIIAVVVIVGVVYAGARLGNRLSGGEVTPADPWQVLFGVLEGTMAWPRASTYLAAGATVLLVVRCGAVAVWWGRRSHRPSRIDWAAQWSRRQAVSCRRDTACIT